MAVVEQNESLIQKGGKFLCADGNCWAQWTVIANRADDTGSNYGSAEKENAPGVQMNTDTWHQIWKSQMPLESQTPVSHFKAYVSVSTHKGRVAPNVSLWASNRASIWFYWNYIYKLRFTVVALEAYRTSYRGEHKWMNSTVFVWQIYISLTVMYHR